MKKKYIVILIIVILGIIGIIFFNIKNSNKKDEEIKAEETTNAIKETEETDAYIETSRIKVEDLDKLTIDDYMKYNSIDIHNLHLDDIDNYYFYKMMEEPGIYKVQATREEREKIYYYENNPREAILEMCKKNGDWSLTSYSLVINNNDDNKINEKNGLLKDFNYTEIDGGEWVGDDYSGYVDIVARNDKEERKYRIHRSEETGQMHIDIKHYETRDLNTNKIDESNIVKFDKENIEDNFAKLCKYEKAYTGGSDWMENDIAISNNFQKKYPYFLDLFIHYSPLEYNEITLKDLDTEKQIATFEVDSVLECKKRTYELKYKLTDDLYLDDVEVNKINEIETEAKLNNFNFPLIFYKNTDWLKYKDVINYNEKFYNKFNENCSYFSDIDLIDVDNFKFEEPYFATIKVNDDRPGSVVSYMLKNNEINFYYWKVIRDKDGKLEDYIHLKLPYTNISLEEVREKFLSDKELQKELGIEIE